MENIYELLGTFNFVIANNAAALRELRELLVAVEAEFGDECVEGELLTLAHHGARAGNPPPCVTEVPEGMVAKLLGYVSLKDGKHVALSHLDLDALGGCWRMVGYKTASVIEEAFWTLAGEVDVQGAHKLPVLIEGKGEEYRKAGEMIFAWWAWSEQHKLLAPRDGTRFDCTQAVLTATEVVQRILSGDEVLLEAGRTYKEAGERLNAASFLCAFPSHRGVVVIRRSENFVNHIYNTPTGEQGDIVIALNSKVNSITVSREGDAVELDCCAFVQSLWGTRAGGRPGIAGSPRGEVFGLDKLAAAVADLGGGPEVVALITGSSPSGE